MMNLGRYGRLWLWAVNVNVEDTIQAFLGGVGKIMKTSVWNQNPGFYIQRRFVFCRILCI
jgi:hypothetical protein